MKRYKVTWLLPALAVLLFSAQSQAEGSDGYGASFMGKVSHGFANMTMGFLEMPKNVINISNDSNILVGATLGTLRGSAEGVSRTLVGVVDLLSSPFSTSDFAKPGYPWERFSEDSRYFGAAYPFHWTHMGPLDDGDALRLE